MTTDTPDQNKPPLLDISATGNTPPRTGTGNGNPPESNGLTPGAITDAVVALMRAANPGAEPDKALAARVAGDIQPGLQQQLASDRATTGQELLTGPGFATVVTQYLGSPQSGYLDDAMRKAMLAQFGRTNVTSGENVAMARGLGFDLMAGGARGDNSGRRFDALADLSAIKSNSDYQSSRLTAGLVSAGVTYDTFTELRNLGFSLEQMRGAAGFTGKTLGLNVNDNIVAVASLRRGLTDADPALTAQRDNYKEIATRQKELAEARASGDPARIAEAEKHLQEMQQYTQDYKAGYTKKIEERGKSHLAPDWQKLNQSLEAVHVTKQAAVAEGKFAEAPVVQTVQAKETKRRVERQAAAPQQTEDAGMAAFQRFGITGAQPTEPKSAETKTATAEPARPEQQSKPTQSFGYIPT